MANCKVQSLTLIWVKSLCFHLASILLSFFVCFVEWKRCQLSSLIASCLQAVSGPGRCPWWAQTGFRCCLSKVSAFPWLGRSYRLALWTRLPLDLKGKTAGSPILPWGPGWIQQYSSPEGLELSYATSPPEAWFWSLSICQLFVVMLSLLEPKGCSCELYT